MITECNSVYYFFFEKCRESILKSKAKVAAAAATSATATIVNGGALTTFESILAGLIAGTATTVSTNPIWIVNTRQTVRVGSADPKADPKAAAAAVKRLGFLQTMQKIVREEGPLALWKGLGPALVLVINPVLQYTAFEQLKNWVVKSRLARANGGKVSLSDWDFFWLGALSKLFATGLTYPQIVIKSRQHAGASKGASTNIWTAMTEIVPARGHRRPLPRHRLQASPVRPHRRHPLRQQGARVQHHQGRKLCARYHFALKPC